MKLLDIIKSKQDNTIKYIFLSNSDVLEFSYINKNDGKDIICIPTQTSCNLGCKFCFLTEQKFKVRNISSDELLVGTSFVTMSNKHNDVLLVSYMGCGEPLLNIDNIINSAINIKEVFSKDYLVVRFAVASLVPSTTKLIEFLKKVSAAELPMKFHYSLHSPRDEVRKELMPAAAPASLVFPILDEFTNNTYNKMRAEVHYSLMKGINDSKEDALMLSHLAENFPIKILKLSEKENTDLIGSPNVSEFRKWLESQDMFTEYYEPPGADVGSSCGQFLLDYYNKYQGQ